jgi:hypothetical protein
MSYYKNQYIPTIIEASTSQSTLDTLLDNETQQNRAEQWNKLNKTIKIQKINIYADKYASENGMNEEESDTLKRFLLNCLDKARLQKTKDVQYDKVKQEIIGIPALMYNTTHNKFTLKNLDTIPKRVTTLKKPVGQKQTLTVGELLPNDSVTA